MGASVNEAQLRAEVGRTLRKLWYRTHVFTDMTRCDVCGNEKFPPGGIPDMIFWDWKGPVGFIEFKMFPTPSHGGWARTSLSLSKISPTQRAWLLFAQETGGYHLYVGLGTVHGRAGATKEPRMAWVVPWDYWQTVETDLLPIQKSLPLTLRPGLRREIQDRDLTATTLLRDYELEWADGGWQFPRGHPIGQAKPSSYGLERNLKKARARWTQIREEQKEIWKSAQP